MTQTTPVAARDNWLDAPYNRWGFRHVPELCRTATIERGSGPVRELPRAERDLAGVAFEHRGRRSTLDEMLAATFTDGFLVVTDGAIVTERYLDGFEPTDTHLLMSCSKSLTSLLCGVLVGQGRLDPEDAVTRHLPELAGTAWDGSSLQDLLDMRSGVAWDYDVDEYTILDVSDYRTHERHGRIPRDTEAWIRTIPAGDHPPGTGAFRYCSLATDVLGWAASRAGGAPFPELFAREVWSRIGAEQDAQIMLDRSGFAIVEGGICTTLRDLARVGLVCLDDGRAPGGQLVPGSWLERLRRHDPELESAFAASAEVDEAAPGAFYHDCWWIDDAARGVYAALGMNGQSLLVHHPSRTVIAKLSTFPDALDWDLFDLHHAGMIALCEHLGGAGAR
jgi:CubicO group peptidase (beta-lactamase class C family)